MIKAVITNLKQFDRQLTAETNRLYKAAKDAAKIEAYRLRDVLREEIKQGAPGGQKFKPITELARRSRKKYYRNKPPLYTLYKPIRYEVVKNSKYIKDPKHEIHIGIGLGAPEISASWKRIARMQQDGGVFIDKRFKYFSPWQGRVLTGQEAVRDYLLHKSVERKPRRYALRKETRVFKLPPRPIIGPFWNKYQKIALKNIEDNFERKARGEWI